MLGPKFGTVKSFYKNQIIFKEGQLGNVGYLVKTGEVTIFKIIDDEQKVLAKLGPGEIFGEMGIVIESPRTAFAQAGEYCDLVVIDKETLHSLLKKSPKLIQSITLLLMQRLANTNKLLEKHDDDVVLPKHYMRICSLLDIMGEYDKGIDYHLFCKRAVEITPLGHNQVETIIKRLDQLNIIAFDIEHPSSKDTDIRFKVCVDRNHLMKTAKKLKDSHSKLQF
ncbi:MAG: cyclic nucleotide-binding domain-containing protein [Desulfobacula sp.]|nr:cyclic nucleotide-binding domain-containing protein [Desulfobacula sp.]